MTDDADHNILVLDDDGDEIDEPTVTVGGTTIVRDGSPVGGNGEDVLFTESNGTAVIEDHIDTMDLQESDIENIHRMEMNIAIDRLQEDEPTSSSVTIDVTEGSVWSLDISGDIEIGFTGASSAGVYSVTLLIDRGSGGHQITWTSDVEWEDGTAPDLTGGGLAVVSAFTKDSGTSWQALLSAEGFS